MRIGQRGWRLLMLLLLLILIAPGLLWWRTRNINASRIQNLRDLGYPTSEHELDRYFNVPSGSIDKTKEWVTTIHAIEKKLTEDRIAKLPFVGGDWEIQNQVTPPGIAWPQFEMCRKLLREEVKSELDHLLELGHQPGEIRLPVVFSNGFMQLVGQTSHYRLVVRWLKLDARVSAHEGNSKRVLEDILTEARWSRHVRRVPVIMSFLVGHALFAVASDEIENWLASCDWSDHDLEQLQIELSLPDFREDLRQAFIGERAMGISGIAHITLGPFRESVLSEYLKTLEEAIESCDLAWPELLQRQSEIEARLVSLGKKPLAHLQYNFVCQIGGAITQAGVATARLTARQRCVVLLIAAQRFRIQHGRLPTRLEELESDEFFPMLRTKDCFTDPFNGKPLRFRWSDQGVKIYSVAEDREDNGGLIRSVETSQPKDLGFLLFRDCKVHDLSR